LWGRMRKVSLEFRIKPFGREGEDGFKGGRRLPVDNRVFIQWKKRRGWGW